MPEQIVSRDIINLTKSDFTTQDSVAGSLTEIAKVQVPQGIRYILHPDLPIQIKCHDGAANLTVGDVEIRKENATRKRHLTAFSTDLAFMQGNPYDKNERQVPEQATVFNAGEWMTIFVNTATATDVSNAGVIHNIKVIEESVRTN